MKKEFIVSNCGGRVGDHTTDLSDDQEAISAMLGITPSESDDNGDDDDDGGEVVTNAQELREISIMLGVDNQKSKPSKAYERV